LSRRTREQAILELVEEHVVSNQSELVALLRERQIEATQATVSRDIKRLGLIKRPARRGGYRYASPQSVTNSATRGRKQLRTACEQFLTKIDVAESLLILRTPNGRANALAVALDECSIDGVAGTLAGDDTVLVLLHTVADRARVRTMFEEMVS
jgi:transcriptional regulator of arginine metabolism